MTLAILRTLKEDIDLSARVVYIAPFKELCEERAADWLKRFMKIKEDGGWLRRDPSKMTLLRLVLSSGLSYRRLVSFRQDASFSC